MNRNATLAKENILMTQTLAKVSAKMQLDGKGRTQKKNKKDSSEDFKRTKFLQVMTSYVAHVTYQSHFIEELLDAV